jgi:hypothetical protein
MTQAAGRRDPLVGQFFIAFDTRGQPTQAGQIKSSIAPGQYIAAFTFDVVLGPHGECITAAHITLNHWNLYLAESTWRAAFAHAAPQEARGVNQDEVAAEAAKGVAHEQSPRSEQHITSVAACDVRRAR